MKIQLVIHHELTPNAGASGSTYRVCEQFVQLGHETSIYSYSDLPRRLSPRLRQLLFPVFVAAFLAREVRRGRPDVVDASTGDTWLWSLLDPARRRVTLATTCHGLEHRAALARRESRRSGILDLSWKFPLYYGGLHLHEVAVTLRRADVAIFLNHSDCEYAVEKLGVDPEHTAIASNGISELHGEAPFEPTPTAPGEPIGIAQVGSWLVQKGVTFSAPALSRTLRTHENARVSLLGTGAETATVLAAFDAEVRDRITVLPRYDYDDLPVLLRGHQITIFPTLFEGFGTALLEGMACGLAAVTTRTGGPQEFIADGENGLLVPPRDTGALEAALARLIDDRDLLDRLRRAARATAHRFTWRAAAEQRLAAYRRAQERRDR